MPRESTVKRLTKGDKAHKGEKPAAKPAAKTPARAAPAVSAPAKSIPVKIATPAAVVPAAPAVRPPPPRVTETRVSPVMEDHPLSIRLGDVSSENLLSMPMSEYMNDTQLRFFRDMLLDMKRQLLENAGETS